MKISAIILISIFSILASASQTTADFDSAQKLGLLWENEEIYFKAADKNELLLWNGLIYHYPSKKCFELKQKEISKSVQVKEAKCEFEFLSKATEPYLEISDFEKYNSKFLTCLKNIDKKCLAGLISKTLKLSLGVDGYNDRRDYIFENWKKEDFNRLYDLVKKGCVGDGDSRTFPSVVSNDGYGHRGEFKKENSRWLLKLFLAGD